MTGSPEIDLREVEADSVQLIRVDGRFALRISVAGECVDVLITLGMACNLWRDAAVFIADDVRRLEKSGVLPARA